MSQFDSPWEDEDEDEEEAHRLAGEGELAPAAGYVPLRLPDFRDVPGTQDLQWATLINQYGLDVCPYESPRDEYLLNTHSLNQQTMLYRWRALEVEAEIIDLYTNPKWPTERIKAQAIRMKDLGLPDPRDEAWKEQVHRSQVFALWQEIENLKHEIEQRVETVRVHIRNFNGGIIRTEEATMSMSAQTLDRNRRRLVELMDAYRELQGDKVRKVETTVEAGPSMRDMLREAMNANNWKTQTGMSMEELAQERAGLKALPEGAAIEGEIVDRVLEQAAALLREAGSEGR